VKELLKAVFLKYVIRYQNPKKYWNMRWKLHHKILYQTRSDFKQWYFQTVTDIMTKYDCNNILEVGCGLAHLRELPGYLGLDFSSEVLKRSGLQNFISTDITNEIALPDKSYDAVLSIVVLMHIPFGKIEQAVSEISRVAKKCVILFEPWGTKHHHTQPHTFSHNLPLLFKKHFDGVIIFEDIPQGSPVPHKHRAEMLKWLEALKRET